MTIFLEHARHTVDLEAGAIITVRGNKIWLSKRRDPTDETAENTTDKRLSRYSALFTGVVAALRGRTIGVQGTRRKKHSHLSMEHVVRRILDSSESR